MSKDRRAYDYYLVNNSQWLYRTKSFHRPEILIEAHFGGMKWMDANHFMTYDSLYHNAVARLVNIKLK